METPRVPVVFVDVDDTLVRHAGPKSMPIAATVEHVKQLAAAGFQLFCWSRGGADYARAQAAALGIEERFLAFLPKPDVMIDDEEPARLCRKSFHPNELGGVNLEDYLDAARGAAPPR
jgi:hypothetical protein